MDQKYKDRNLKNRFGVQVAVVAWIDLLGYGSQISTANFYPLHKKAKEANQRLNIFHEIVAKHSVRVFPSVVMNDGAIIYSDLSYGTTSRTQDFIQRSWNLFEEVSKVEENHGQPGPRMFIAAGFRKRGRRAGLDKTAGHLKSIFARLNDGKISVEQAVNEAARSTAKFDIIPQLQSNYAFTKAYLADAAGSSAGFSGSKVFLDMTLIDRSKSLSPLDLGPSIFWTHEDLNLKTEFAELRKIQDNQNESNTTDVFNTGLTVASQLSGDPKFVEKIYSDRKKHLS